MSFFLLAKHLKLEVKKAMGKHQIQNIVVEHLVSLKVFKEPVLETVETSDSEWKKLQLQLGFKKLEMQEKLEREDRERQERLEEKQRQKRLEREKKIKTRKTRKRRKGKTRKKGRKGTTREVRKRENGIATWVWNEKVGITSKVRSDPSVEKSSAKLMFLSLLSFCHHFNKHFNTIQEKGP